MQTHLSVLSLVVAGHILGCIGQLGRQCGESGENGAMSLGALGGWDDAVGELADLFSKRWEAVKKEIYRWAMTGGRDDGIIW